MNRKYLLAGCVAVILGAVIIGVVMVGGCGLWFLADSGNNNSSSSALSLLSSGPSEGEIIDILNNDKDINGFEITNKYERNIDVNGVEEHAYFIRFDYTSISLYTDATAPSNSAAMPVAGQPSDYAFTINGVDYHNQVTNLRPYYIGIKEIEVKRSEAAFIKRGSVWYMTRLHLGEQTSQWITPLNQEEKNVVINQGGALGEYYDPAHLGNRVLFDLVYKRNRHPANNHQ